MATRPLWKATLRIEDFYLPVKLYSAVEDRNVHFHLLHDQDLVRIRQRFVHPETGETIPYAETHRAVPVDSDRLVVLDQEELEELGPEESREIATTAFVPTGSVRPEQHERPYYLGPDESEADYFALAQALTDSGREGFARWNMRKKRYVGLLTASDNYLMLITLRYSAEVIQPTELEPPQGRSLDAKELTLAKQLIDTLVDDFDLSEYRDEYRERVQELVAAKQRGGALPEYVERPKQTGSSLADSLAASLRVAKGS